MLTAWFCCYLFLFFPLPSLWSSLPFICFRVGMSLPIARAWVSFVMACAARREKMVTTMNVTMDPTLSRTYNVRCTNCDAHEAVYFQCPAGRSDSALVLQYVCVVCQHTWLSSDQE